MDKNLFHKLVQHGHSQVLKILIPIHQRDELLRGFLLIAIIRDGLFQFPDFREKRVFLRCVFRVQIAIALVGQFTEDVILINLIQHSPNIAVALFRRCQTRLLFANVAVQILRLCLLNCLDERLSVRLGKFHNGPEHGGDQVHYHRFIDTVLRGTQRTDRIFAVGRTGIL